jgi:hypothetical protein
MIVAGRAPSRKARICEAMCSFGRPASATTSFVVLRPSVPWAAGAGRGKAAGRRVLLARGAKRQGSRGRKDEQSFP